MKTIAVTGAHGMLGVDLCALLRAAQFTVIELGRADLDITNTQAVNDHDGLKQADWVVNCAAYTAVDSAEADIEAALLTNIHGPVNLVRKLQPHQRLIQVSTDFVFNGQKKSPYLETDPVDPLGVYGDSKMQAEDRVLMARPDSLVFRTSWLFGPHGRSFPRTIITAWEAGRDLRVVDDQIGCPTYTPDLAESITQAIEKELAGGIYHACGSEAVTWFQFANLVLEKWRSSDDPRPIDIAPVPTSEYPTPAKRPPYSVLSNRKLAAATIDPWRPLEEAVAEFCLRHRKLQLLR